MAQREPKQSQLDYLWKNFGEYSVSTSEYDKQIPTLGLVQELLDTIRNQALHSLQVVGYKLIGTNINGNKLCEIDISQLTSDGRSIVEFGKRYVKDTDKEIQHPVGTPIYYIKLADGTELAVEANEGGIVYSGSETSTVVINIEEGQIRANLKTDNEDSVINLSESSKGLRADLIIDPESNVKATKTANGLKLMVDANIELDDYYTKDEVDDKLNWNELT